MVRAPREWGHNGTYGTGKQMDHIGSQNLIHVDFIWSIWDYLGIYKKPRPFNHIFGGDRILRT